MEVNGLMRKHLGLLLRTVVSVGILYYLFNSIFQKESPEHPWTEGSAKLWATFCSVDPLWLGAAVLCFLVICVVNIIRWQIILRVQDIRISLKRAAELFFIGHFFNSFMLGATGGDVVKAYYVAQETHHKKAEAVMTVIIDRLIGLVGLFAVAAVMLLLNLRVLLNNDSLRPMAIAVLSLLAVLLICLFVGFWPGLGRALHRWRERVFGARPVSVGLTRLLGEGRSDRWRGRFAKVREQVKKMIGAYQAYAGHKPALVKTFLLALVTHLSLILTALCIGNGLHIAVAPQYYLVMVPAINCIAAIPITIGGLGVREGLFVESMVAFVGATGLGATTEVLLRQQALSLSLLCFAIMVFFSIIGGVVYLFFERTHPSAAQVAAEAE